MVCDVMKSSVTWFTTQMATMGRMTELGDQRTPSGYLTWMTGFQILGPSSAAFPGTSEKKKYINKKLTLKNKKKSTHRFEYLP